MVRRFREYLTTLGLPLVAVCLVLFAWSIAKPRQPDADEPPEESSGEDGAAATRVNFSRPGLVSAAGLQVAEAEPRRIVNSVSCSGSASFNQNKYVKVPPRANGIVRQIFTDVGANVRAGEVLAIVSSQAFGDLKASLVKALVHEEHLRWQVEKYRATVEGIAAKSLYETQHLLEEQVTDTARIRERLLGHGLTTAEVAAIAKNNDISTQLSVIAPRDGQIVDRHAVEGEPVDVTTPLFAIADLASMWVHLYAYEDQLSYVHLNQKVTFRPDGLPDRGFEGTITWISPEVDPQTRTIQLRAEVANPDGALRANMFGKGELAVGDARTRLAVPQEAVQSHGGRHIVFVQQPNGSFEARPVAIGLKGKTFWEVTSGLRSGEKVATTGSFLLKSNLENADFGKVE